MQPTLQQSSSLPVAISAYFPATSSIELAGQNARMLWVALRSITDAG